MTRACIHAGCGEPADGTVGVSLHQIGSFTLDLCWAHLGDAVRYLRGLQAPPENES